MMKNELHPTMIILVYNVHNDLHEVSHEVCLASLGFIIFAGFGVSEGKHGDGDDATKGGRGVGYRSQKLHATAASAC
jgi:hypothetical protein